MHHAHHHRAPADRRTALDGPPPAARRWLNLGILAHVDAGKTSLTEALLQAGGALERAGRVDDGTTTTDTLALERRRGITIKTAVANFVVDDVAVNLIDTPGHPDFIAEVDRSLAVLDAAILVVSAVEGVQAQTIVLYRALRRLGVPVMFFINKIDRPGADPDLVIAAIARRLTRSAIVLGTVARAGTAVADYLPYDLSDRSVAEELTARLADHDQSVFDAWINRGTLLDNERFVAGLRRLARRGTVQPLSMGSAITGSGVARLIEVVTTLFPIAPPKSPTTMGGQVFKIERSPSGDRACYLRLRSGTIAMRDVVEVDRAEVGRVTELEVCEPAGFVRRDHASAGQVVRVHGLGVRLGDRIGTPTTDAAHLHFSPPALETTVTARDGEQQFALHRALVQIADFDPLIGVRPDDHGGLKISIYGEVQQQVIADTLALDYGIEVDFRATTIICVERPVGVGRAIRWMADPDHRYGYTLGIEIAPNHPGAGIDLAVAVPRADIPLHVYSTVEGFHDALLGYLGPALQSGPQGWRVVDLRITVTNSGYVPPGPPPADVRHTAEIVVTEAIRRAGTMVCEPIEQFRLETPAPTLPNVLNLLGRLRAQPNGSETFEDVSVITGTVPTAELDELRRALHGATHGEGVLESELDHYAPLRRT